jgi:hypothetical protein
MATGAENPAAVARALVQELYGDRPPGEQRSKFRTLAQKYRMGLVRGEADPLTDVVMSSTSNTQKVAVIEAQAASMSRGALEAWLRAAVAHGVVSKTVAGRVLAQRGQTHE